MPRVPQAPRAPRVPEYRVPEGHQLFLLYLCSSVVNVFGLLIYKGLCKMNRKSRNNCLFILLVIIAAAQFMAFFPGLVHAQNGSPGRKPDKAGKVIFVVVDRINWEDILNSDVPVIKQLAAKGAVGLMTTNPAAPFTRNPENTYATIGAGAKIGGEPQGAAGFNAQERYRGDLASDIYMRSTGSAAGEHDILFLGLAEMEKANQPLKYRYSIGSIGTLLHQNGLKTAVFGNADLSGPIRKEGNYRRYAVLMAMDSKGLVDYGDVSEKTTKPSLQSPSGIKSDYNEMLIRFGELREKANFIVFETGDTSRLDEMNVVITEEVQKSAKKRALGEIDAFLGRLIAQIDLNKDLLMLVVPGPSYGAMGTGHFLTPVIIAGSGVQPGVVWSGTIKREGLIANTDLASTVARYFDLSNDDLDDQQVILSGQTIETRETRNALQKISQLERDIVFMYNSRYPLVKSYVNSELVVMIIFIAALLLGKPSARYLIPVMIAFTAVPLVMLLAGWLPHPSLAVTVIEMIGLTTAITLLAITAGRKNPLDPFIITTGLTMTVIIVDLFAGAPLAKLSPLSYDVITGARFYGLGNEFMGVLIGCSIVFTSLILDRWKPAQEVAKAGAVLLFLLIIYTIAAPNLGTNVGGTIAAVAGLGAAGIILYGFRVSGKSVAVLVACIGLVLATFIAYDMTRAMEAQSHIGRTASLIRQNGLSEIADIISRKWDMNLKLIINTSWSWFYFISILAMIFLGRRFSHEKKRFSEKYPYFAKTLPSVYLGSAFALIFNDSGIVAAATMIIFAAAPFLTELSLETRK